MCTLFLCWLLARALSDAKEGVGELEVEREGEVPCKEAKSEGGALCKEDRSKFLGGVE